MDDYKWQTRVSDLVDLKDSHAKLVGLLIEQEQSDAKYTTCGTSLQAVLKG